MRAIDTNLIVRFLTGDDPLQAEKAREIITGGSVFVATTVILESEWVLRSAYGFPGSQIAEVLRMFAGLPGVVLEDATLISGALDWAEQGMDFADALHLGRAAGCASFVTFDRKLQKLAERVSDIDVVCP